MSSYKLNARTMRQRKLMWSSAVVAVLLFAAIAIASSLLLHPNHVPQWAPDDEAFEQQAYEERIAHGPENVIAASNLVAEFSAGEIDEAAFIAELWRRYPLIAGALYERWGTFNSIEYLNDIVFAQTNGPIAYDEHSLPIFFVPVESGDEAEPTHTVSDSQREVVAVAHQLLRQLWIRWHSDPNTMFLNPTNNKCCQQGAIESCVPSSGHNCNMALVGNRCGNDSHMCPSVVKP